MDFANEVYYVMYAIKLQAAYQLLKEVPALSELDPEWSGNNTKEYNDLCRYFLNEPFVVSLDDIPEPEFDREMMYDDDEDDERFDGWPDWDRDGFI